MAGFRRTVARALAAAVLKQNRGGAIAQCAAITLRPAKKLRSVVVNEEESERILSRLAKKMADDMMETLCGTHAFNKPLPTALRMTPSGNFEVVELQDDGSVIEPMRCTCGRLAIIHHSKCPMAPLMTP